MPDSELPVITIQTGEYIAGKGPGIFKTLLGSCVSACLYEPSLGVAGMNHFLLATDKSVNPTMLMDTTAGYYGIHAMELLINDMLGWGVTRSNIKAKIFGGGNVLSHYGVHGGLGADVGQNNIDFLIGFLNREGIPIVARDVGGNSGRVIFFNTQDYTVKVRTIDYEQKVGVVQHEANYLAKERAKQSHGTDSIEFLDRK